MKFKLYKDLTMEEAGIIDASLDFFRTCDIAGVSGAMQQANNAIADAAKHRIKAFEIAYLADEIRIMCLAMSRFVKYISEEEKFAGLNNPLDFDDYMAIASSTLHKLRVMVMEDTLDVDGL